MKQRQRFDQTQFGITVTILELYDEKVKYTIQAGACQKDTLTDAIYPFSVPPFATFVGNTSANVEKWRVGLGPIVIEESVDVSDPKLGVPTLFNVTAPFVSARTHADASSRPLVVLTW